MSDGDGGSDRMNARRSGAWRRAPVGRRRQVPGATVWLGALLAVALLFALPEWLGEGAAVEAAGQSAGRARSAPTIIAGTASVIDGDTVEIHGQRLRLHAIDAPESRQTCLRDGVPWRCGQAAALALAARIGRQPLRCQQTDTDRYQRVVARCHLGSEDLGGWLVGQGLAMAYRPYGRDYVAQEAAARAARKGLWASEFTPPWDWRRAQRQARRAH